MADNVNLDLNDPLFGDINKQYLADKIDSSNKAGIIADRIEKLPDTWTNKLLIGGTRIDPFNLVRFMFEKINPTVDEKAGITMKDWYAGLDLYRQRLTFKDPEKYADIAGRIFDVLGEFSVLPGKGGSPVKTGGKFALQEALQFPVGEEMDLPIGEFVKRRAVSAAAGAVTGAAVGKLGEVVKNPAVRIPVATGGFAGISALMAPEGEKAQAALDSAITVLGFEAVGLAQQGLYKRAVKKAMETNPKLKDIAPEKLEQQIKDKLREVNKNLPEEQFAQRSKDLIEAEKSKFDVESPHRQALDKVAEDLSNPIKARQIMENVEVAQVRNGKEIPSSPRKLAMKMALAEEGESETATDVVRKLTDAMHAAEAPREATIKAQKFEKAKRFSEHSELLKSKSGKDAFYAARSALKGELPEVNFELPHSINSLEEHTLVEMIRTNKAMTGLEKDNTFGALQKILRGKAPAPFEIKLLDRAFGKEFANEAARLEKLSLSFKQKLWRTAQSIINVPHAMLASSDLSGSGRQGFFAGTSHPLLWARMTKAGARSLVSDKHARFVDTQIRTNKYYESATKAGIKIRDYGGVSSNKADKFMTDLLARNPNISKLTGYKRVLAEIANIIPTVVSASERAYVTSLNKFRMDLYANYARKWEGLGRTSSDYKSLANLINHATGESNNKFIENNASLFNAAFFAPRWAVSRFELVGDLAFQTPAVRKVAAKMWVNYLVTGVSALSLLALAGFDVETDPKSSDFGKARYGNTRFDFWGGHSQMARVTAQLLTGKKKTTTGKIKDQSRLKTIGRFLESKVSPLAGLGIDLLRGETYIGEDVYGENANYMEQFYNRMAPLFMQDVIDAARYQGVDTAIPSAPLAFMGIGMQTYPIRPSQAAMNEKDKFAQEAFGKPWDDIGPLAQQALKKYHPEIDIMERQAAFEMSKEKQLKIDLSEQKKAGRNVLDKLPENVQNEMEILQVAVGGLSRKIGSGWYLNDERYKYYQDETARLLNNSLKKVMSRPGWRNLNEQQKQELLEYIIDGTKKNVRNKLVTTAKISDLQSLKEMRK